MKHKNNKEQKEKHMKKYTYDEAYKATLEYFKGNELATNVTVGKYLLKDKEGNYLELTPDDMHRRLAGELTRIERKYPNAMSEDEIYDLLKDFGKVILQGSPMSGVGNQYQLQTLGNCFVVDGPSDSYSGILRADQELVQLMKRRAGVGLDISKIRPKGVATANAAQTSDGIAVFMERFSSSCREVAQNGRRGAELQTIHCNHPETDTFINIKRDLKKVTGANVSIRVTDEFMQAVVDDSEFTHKWPIDAKVPKITKTVKARELWNQFVDATWSSAEPGLIFEDRLQNYNSSSGYGEDWKIASMNPCVVGETLVETNAGPKTIKELADNNALFLAKCVNLDTKEVEFKEATAFKTRDSAKVLRLKTKSGKELLLTTEHMVLTKRGWIEAQNLDKKTDKILSA